VNVVLNVKVGDKVTFKTPSGETLDGKVTAFPKVIRVQADDGRFMDIAPEDVIAEEPGKSGAGKFASRLNQSRL
jgi:hypothetical protein